VRKEKAGRGLSSQLFRFALGDVLRNLLIPAPPPRAHWRRRCDFYSIRAEEESAG
jgi:hypothetical protein